MSTSAWSSPKAHNAGPVRSWCVQCGTEGRPVAAVGWDEEGDPACAGHQVKAARPLKLSEPIDLPPIELEPISIKEPSLSVAEERTGNRHPTAAPSPVQTSVVEATMRSQPIYQPRACIDCGTNFNPPGARSQRCESCLHTHQSQAKSTLAKKYYAKKKKQVSKPALGGAIRIPAPVEPPNEDTTPVHLTAEKLDKLWNLLSLGEKASAIEHVL